MEIQGMILAAIRSIQERNQRANFESVAVYIEKKHGLNKSDIILQINQMINSGKINSVWFRGGESFRIDETESQNSASNDLPDNNSSSPPLSNNVSRSTLHFTENMSYGPPDDLIEFKKYVHAEMLALKALVSNRTISENSRSSREPIDYERIVIKSLEDRIISLERQLNQKQRMIEALLESRSSPPPRSGEAPTPKGPSPKQTKQNTAASNPEQKQKGQSKASGRIDVSKRGVQVRPKIRRPKRNLRRPRPKFLSLT